MLYKSYQFLSMMPNFIRNFLLYFAIFGYASAFLPFGRRIQPFQPTHLVEESIPKKFNNQWALSVSNTPVRDATSAADTDKDAKKKIGTVAILLPSQGAHETILSKFGEKSPVDPPPLLDAAKQLVRKNTHFSVDLVDTDIVMVPREGDDDSMSEISQQLQNVDVLLALGLQSDWDMKFAEELFQERRNRDESCRNRQCHFALDCAKKLPAVVGPYDETSPPILAAFPWTLAASAQRMKDQMEGLFGRRTTDDFSNAIMIFLNQFSGKKVDWVKHSIDATWEKGPVQNAEEFVSMVSKCGDCVVKCVQDENCKECLDKLTEIDTRDQVASYRTIVSYESDLLRDFSFCILQKNNIFGCDATIPELPKVPPITEWRGKPLTREDGRAILIGHLDDEMAPEVRLAVAAFFFAKHSEISLCS